jgi:two-component system cell cycle sensor histidine kinase/response regulator CckA
VTTILLLDDNPLVLQMLGLILRSRGGYSVLEACTRQEAVDRFEQRSFEIDLLVADVCVGGQAGRTIADQLTTICPHLRVLFISGYPKEHLVGNGSLEPDDAFLAKPFAPDKLLRGVAAILGHPHEVPAVNVRTARAAWSSSGAS